MPAAKDDERGSDGGGDERGPANEVEALTGKDGGGDGEQDGHGADHERGVADSGACESVELQEELDGNPEKSGEKQKTELAAGEAHAVDEGDGKHAEAGKEEAVEDHGLDGHLVKREAAEVEARSPERSGERAGAITEEGGAPIGGWNGGHLYF